MADETVTNGIRYTPIRPLFSYFPAVLANPEKNLTVAVTSFF